MPSRIESYRVHDHGQTRFAFLDLSSLELSQRIGLNWQTAKSLQTEGLLSFDPGEIDKLTDAQAAELDFLGRLVVSGCDFQFLKYLLSELDKLYAYDIRRVFYDWSSQSWERRHLPKDTTDLIPVILEDLAGAGDREQIEWIVSEAKSALAEMEDEVEEEETDDEEYKFDIDGNAKVEFMNGVNTAKHSLQLLLRQPGIKPEEMGELGKALEAVERLPEITPYASFEFGIHYRNGTEDYEEMKYFNFLLSEESLEISSGGSVYSKDVGSDSYSDGSWSAQASGYMDTEMDLTGVVDSIAEYLNLGAEISISCE